MNAVPRPLKDTAEKLRIPKVKTLAPSPSFPVVDYASHPAFHELIRPWGREDDTASHLFEKLDRALEKFLQCDGTQTYTESFFDRAFRKEIDPLFEKLFSQSRRLFSGVLQSVVDGALHETRERCILEAKYIATADYKLEGDPLLETCTGAVTQSMKENGFSAHLIPPDAINELSQMTLEYREPIRRLAAASPKMRADMPIPMKGKYWEAIMEMMRQTGVLSGSSRHLGHSLVPIYCAISLSHSKQKWWMSCYDDLGIPTSPLAYLHVDDDFDLTKFIIYLDDVKVENGPFQCIPGSHRWPRPSLVQYRFFKSIDQSFARAKLDPGIRSDYYRSRFVTAENRKWLGRLPRPFQGTSHMGDDIMAGSELHRVLESQIITMPSSVANCFVFEGGRLLHRGGLCEQGERWSLQMAFYQPQTEIRKANPIASFARIFRKIVGESNYHSIRRRIIGRY